MIVEWRIIWAEGLTAEERSNLRSWGVDCPEPPVMLSPNVPLPPALPRPVPVIDQATAAARTFRELLARAEQHRLAEAEYQNFYGFGGR